MNNFLLVYLSIVLLLSNTAALSEQNITPSDIAARYIVESSNQSAGFSFTTYKDRAEPVIHYQQNIQMLSSMTGRPSLSIFGDGRVLVHHPLYMKKAGDYEMRLSAVELKNIIRTLSGNGVMDFDSAKVRGKVKAYEQAQREKGRFYAVSDAVETVIDIRLDEYQKNITSVKINNFHKQFKWKNIEHDAARYKNDIDLTKANSSISQLKAMMNDARLVEKKP